MSVRRVPAPGLRETADIWFDDGADPFVEWDEQGRAFDLVSGAGASGADPAQGGSAGGSRSRVDGDPDAGSGDRARLRLWRAPAPVAQPREVALALAEGLAACDFPPTGDGAAEGHVAAALRAAGLGD